MDHNHVLRPEQELSVLLTQHCSDIMSFLLGVAQAF